MMITVIPFNMSLFILITQQIEGLKLCAGRISKTAQLAWPHTQTRQRKNRHNSAARQSRRRKETKQTARNVAVRSGRTRKLNLTSIDCFVKFCFVSTKMVLFLIKAEFSHFLPPKYLKQGMDLKTKIKILYFVKIIVIQNYNENYAMKCIK